MAAPVERDKHPASSIHSPTPQAPSTSFFPPHPTATFDSSQRRAANYREIQRTNETARQLSQQGQVGDWRKRGPPTGRLSSTASGAPPTDSHRPHNQTTAVVYRHWCGVGTAVEAGLGCDACAGGLGVGVGGASSHGDINTLF